MGEDVEFAADGVRPGGGFRLLSSVSAAVDALSRESFAAVPTAEFDEFGRELEQIARALWAAQVRYADEADQRGLAAARSCSSTAALLRQTLRIPMSEASRRVHAARATQPQDLPSGGATPPDLPLLAAAVEAGHLDPDHTRTVLATMHRLPADLDADLRVDAERTLIGYATDVDPDQFRKVAQHLEEVLDPDGHLGTDSVARAELIIGSRCTATGLTSIVGRLDDLGMAVFRKAVDGLAAPVPGSGGTPDLRPVATRRADALIEALRFTLNHAGVPEHGGTRPHITVTLHWDTLRSQAGVAVTDGGATLTPAATRRLLCDANILPAVLGGEGQVLDVGRASRTFTPAMRRAIALRDKGCTWPGCDRPPAFTDAHHVQWWKRDLGPTSYDNGTLLCGYHHTEIHKNEWQIEFAADGVPEFIPPAWLDRSRKPRRNTLHHLVPDTG